MLVRMVNRQGLGFVGRALFECDFTFMNKIGK
ncbi:hypothetical protein J2W52_005353 [Rhizobium miluonense]|uniref:Uncharacterized protein n=1 Tax=Rhizobium miluonense TaxID=411945 RepID=A0ABU1SXQ3_9HYPH|nr:hypothetical protein [Rhizobium miluonense]